MTYMCTFEAHICDQMHIYVFNNNVYMWSNTHICPSFSHIYVIQCTYACRINIIYVIEHTYM